jgi:hypothetical protein
MGGGNSKVAKNSQRSTFKGTRFLGLFNSQQVDERVSYLSFIIYF